MSSKLLRIGITGGIGSGKSTVSRVFEIFGVPIYNADKRAKWLMENDLSLAKGITTAFGNKAFSQGRLNRQYLAEKVFGSEEAVNILNKMVHPVVADDFDNWCSRFRHGYVLKEAALLYETGSYRLLDATILVLSPHELKIARIRKRDPQRSLQQIENIISQQISVDKAKTLANYTLYNNEDEMLIPQILLVHQALQKKADSDISKPAIG